MITWKDLEVFMSDMTEEQKEQRVVLIDYSNGFIFPIDEAILVEETVHFVWGKLVEESETEDYSQNQFTEFIEDIEDSVYEGEMALIVN